MILFLFFIIVLNIVAIALTYYCLSELEKKERVIIIAIGVAIIYILTTFSYWISTRSVAIKEVSDMGKNLITFLFVPINSIIILPLLSKYYAKYKVGNLGFDILKKRAIIFGIILLILLIIECSYFKKIQNSVIEIIEKNRQEQLENEKNKLDITDALKDTNMIIEGQKNEMNNNIMENINNEIIDNQENIKDNDITNIINEEVVY